MDSTKNGQWRRGEGFGKGGKENNGPKRKKWSSSLAQTWAKEGKWAQTGRKGEIDNFIKSNGAPGEIMVVASRRMGTNGWLVAADILLSLPADDAASCLGVGHFAPCLQAFAPPPPPNLTAHSKANNGEVGPIGHSFIVPSFSSFHPFKQWAPKLGIWIVPTNSNFSFTNRIDLNKFSPGLFDTILPINLFTFFFPYSFLAFVFWCQFFLFRPIPHSIAIFPNSSISPSSIGPINAKRDCHRKERPLGGQRAWLDRARARRWDTVEKKRKWQRKKDIKRAKWDTICRSFRCQSFATSAHPSRNN